jgi:uncharacterized membrane protein HdeD (DUF308 family)
MSKDTVYIISVLTMLIGMIAVVIMFFYHMDKTAAFSFTLGVAMVASGIEEKISNRRTSWSYFSWLLAFSSFIIGITRLLK